MAAELGPAQPQLVLNLSHRPPPSVGYSPGARLPQNLQTHIKFLEYFMPFWRKFDFKVRISGQMKKFFLSHTCRKYLLVTGRNFLALQVINCHGKNLLSLKGILYQRQKFLVPGRNCLSQEVISCLVRGRNVLTQEEISWH